MAHISGIDLDNEGEQLILSDKKGLVMDFANEDGEWFKGNGDSPMQSIARKNPPDDGTKAENWKTCDQEGCDGDHWKVPSGNNFGTPGEENL